MRKSRVGRMVLCLIGVAGLAGSARGILVDFSGYTTGELADQGVTMTKWTTTPEDARILVVADSDGNKAAQMQADSRNYGGYLFSPSDSDLGLTLDPSSSVVPYGFKVRWEDLHPGYFGSSWRFYIGTGGYHENIGVFEGTFGGAININYGSSASSEWLMRDDTAAVAGQWYTFSGVIDFGTKTFTVVMNGIYRGTYAFMYSGISNVNLDFLSMNTSNSLFYPVSFDDIRIGNESIGVSLRGTVALDGYTGDKTAIGVKFDLTPAGGATFSRFAELASDGSFQLDNLPAGVYTVAAKTHGSLRATLTGVPVQTNPAVLADAIQLKGADNNGDNQVSFEDFSILQNNYGDSGTAAPSPLTAVTGGCGALGFVLMTIVGLALRCRD